MTEDKKNKIDIKDEADLKKSDIADSKAPADDSEKAKGQDTDSTDNKADDEPNDKPDSDAKEKSEHSDDEIDAEDKEQAEVSDDADGGEDGENTEKADKRDQKIAELNDRYMRLFAEFDNFRKRTETEKAGMFTEGEKTVLLKVLPLIDNFERALAAIPDDEKGSAFAEGMEKVYRAFTDQLKELGVVQIETDGKEFDANLHNAVMHVDDEEKGENVIVEEFQKGYMFKDKVLRYSMVKVAN